MQHRLLLCALGVLSTATVAAQGRVPEGGNTGLVINNSGRIELVQSQAISYLNPGIGNGARRVSLRLAQPVLCADFATASNNVGLVLVDPNAEASPVLLGGITAYNYFTNGGANSSLVVSSSTNLACCVMQPASNATCVQGGNGSPAPVDGVFANGFENLSQANSGLKDTRGTAPGVDVQVQISGPGNVQPGSNLVYTIQVSNFGSTSVSGVRVRDWFPKASGGFPVALGNGSWTCVATAGASCGTTSGSGNVNLDAISLDGFSGSARSVTFTVTRPVPAGAANGAVFSVSAAAFAPPAANESVLANNQSALTSTIQLSQPPVLSGLPTTAVLTNEDTATAAINFSASDADSVLTPASLSCSASSNSALADGSSCQFSGSEPNFTLVVTPKPDANGNVNLTVQVSDGLVAPVTGSFPLTVAAINDPPNFTLQGNLNYNSGTSGIQQVTGFLSGLNAGPPDEAGQTLGSPVVTVLSGSGIFNGGGNPTISNGNLAFSLNGSNGTANIQVSVSDNGSNVAPNQNTRSQNFTITVQAAPSDIRN